MRFFLYARLKVMQKVLTAEEMREVDRLTTERYGIPSIVLMENAAHAVARVTTEKLGGSAEGKSILVLCGKGNNGGDGAAVARLLHGSGASVRVYLLGTVAETKGDARTNFGRLQEIASTNSHGEPVLHFEEVGSSDKWAHVLRPADHRFDVSIDALFGTGLSRPLNGRFREVPVLFRQQSEGRGRNGLVISIDVPSGLNSDSAEEPDIHVSAYTTVTFTAPKPANVLPSASRFNGQLIIADIGSPQGLIDEQPSQLYLAERADLAAWLEASAFTNDSYKNKRGHALLIAGSLDYSGAAVLTGDAAIRSGCGLVTIATPESSRESVVARVQPEVMVRALPETADGTVAENAFDEVTAFLKNVDVIAIGSGMSRNDETGRFVRRIVEERTMPIVVDADALTALSPWSTNGPATVDDDGDMRLVPPLILTPHEGEFRKMLGVEKSRSQSILIDRVAAVRDFATRHGVFLVLKGERNLIGHPDGRVAVNPTGNPGLGKAGNGDTLTGILAGFIAQAVQMKIDVFRTIVAAVYIAGLAGDIAERKYGKRVMTASDVRDCMADAFASLEGTL